MSTQAEQIQFDRSITPAAVPPASNLKEGALAINLVDRQIYTKDHNGNVISLGKDYTDIIAAQATGNQAALDAAVLEITGDLSAFPLAPTIEMLATNQGLIVGRVDTHYLQLQALETFQAAHDFPISDAINSTTSNQYASSLAVKSAYDRAVTAEATAIAYADTVKSELLGGAPAAALDTIAELAAALTDDSSAISSITSNLALKANITDMNTALATKVDVVQITQDATSVDTALIPSSAALAAASTTTLNSSKAYTDSEVAGAVTTLSSYADDKDVIALNAAKAYTDTEVAASAAAITATTDAGLALKMDIAVANAKFANIDYGITF